MRNTVLRPFLAVVLLLTGVTAMWGGYMLMTGGWQMDPAWLRHTPFETWTLPGLATLLFPGLGVALAGVAVLLKVRGQRTIALAAGVGLMAWVAVELVWLRVVHPVMHPLIFGVGVVVALLAWFLPRARPAHRAQTVTADPN